MVGVFFPCSQSSRKMEVIDPPFASTAFVHFRMHESFTPRVISRFFAMNFTEKKRQSQLASCFASVFHFALIFKKIAVFPLPFSQQSKPTNFFAQNRTTGWRKSEEIISKRKQLTILYISSCIIPLLLLHLCFHFHFGDLLLFFFFFDDQTNRDYAQDRITGIKEVWKAHWKSNRSHICIFFSYLPGYYFTFVFVFILEMQFFYLFLFSFLFEWSNKRLLSDRFFA